jgi:hypothetical protein
MEGARGKVNSDIILESTGPRLYSAVFKQYVTEAQDPGTSVVGNFQVGPHPLFRRCLLEQRSGFPLRWEKTCMVSTRPNICGVAVHKAGSVSSNKQDLWCAL